MQLPNNKIRLYIFTIVLTSVLYLFDGFIPKPAPWLRIGFSNIVFLIILKNGGLSLVDLLIVVVFRNIICSILTGSLLGPMFIISFISSFASIITMRLLFSVFREKIGFIGVSVVGACVNMAAQISVGSLLVFHNFILVNALLYFLAFAYISGIITGIVANKVEKLFCSNLGYYHK
mgnify:CR=1 FL=1